MVQGLKWCQSHETVSDKNSTRQQQLCDYLILQKLEHFEVSGDLEWNGEVKQQCEFNT